VEGLRMGDGAVGFFLDNDGKLYRGRPVFGSLVIHSEGATDVDLVGDWGGVVISSSEVEVLDASHSAEVLETQGDISDISGIFSNEVTMGIVVEIGIMLMLDEKVKRRWLGNNRVVIYPTGPTILWGRAT
jgi:hypothetical protein